LVRLPIAFSSLLVLFITCPSLADPILKNGDIIALCGDSTTEQKEYSVFVESYLLAARPANNLRVIQLGWSGETVPTFLTRIGSEVLPFRPTIATVFYGMVDARTAITPQSGQTFGDALKASITALKAGGIRTVLLASPAAVDSTTYTRRIAPDAAAYNQNLAELGDVAQSTAKQNNCLFLDVHADMMDFMAQAKAKYGPRFAFNSADGMRPTRAAHLVVAYALLKALGCNGDLGTITLDLAAGRNQAIGGHRILSAENSSVRIESRRIPFCFFGDNTAASERSMIDLVPFNQDLNRLTLKVINAGPGKLRVTWSGGAGPDANPQANPQTKDFTSDDLSKGINLAAEFPDGPFTDAITRIEKAVRAQQEYETPLVKTLLHSIPVDKQVVPEESATLDRVADGALAHDKALFEAAVAEAAKPVQHTIKIEPVP
jgi:lysophospholipase L1-like esterase